MGFNYNQLTTPGVKHGPWPPIQVGIYALSGIDIKDGGRDLKMERDHQFECSVTAVENAWDEGRISSSEADARLNTLYAAQKISDLEISFRGPAADDPRIKDNQ